MGLTSICICVAVFIMILKIQGIYTLKTRDLQCKLHGYDTVCLDNTDSCTKLTCGRLILDSYYVAHTINSAVEEGTQCGVNKLCKQKKCIPVIPPIPTHEGCESFNMCRSAQPIAVAQTRSEQCIRYGYKGACKEQSTVCNVLYCAERTPKGYVALKMVPRWGVDMGTKCGENKICVNMRCVDVIGEMPIQLGEVTEITCKLPQGNTIIDLPLKTRDEQCKKHGYDVACYFHETALHSECQFLRCGYETIPGHYILPTNGAQPVRKIIPAFRTRCGDNRTCYKKKCVDTYTLGMLVYTGEETWKTCFIQKHIHITTCH